LPTVARLFLPKANLPTELGLPAARLYVPTELGCHADIGLLADGSSAVVSACLCAQRSDNADMIVGTAGHIDHGKTALVRALTGVDTDRLKEEKERGISIELGYAYAPLDNGEVLGFIDVPGHERLVRTMVAGACGIDFALLVVAADDGVMPQTREHLAILELLGLSRGAVALTKIDRVDAERVRQVQAQVRTTLTSTTLSEAPIFALKATAPDDPGTASLRRYLREAASHMPARDAEGLFRLAVDRVFSLAGHGTVVTGTVFAGQVRTGDTVSVMPATTAARVRSIHAQNRPADTGRAGQRCAVSLAGIEKSALARGDWLADPRALAPTTHLDVRLRLLADASVRLATRSTLHVHLGTTHRLAHVVLLESDHLSAGESARVQLVFDAPVCATPGDRFIARDAPAAHTVGGGRVIDPFAPSRKRRSVERLRYLDALEQMIAGSDAAPLLQQASYGVTMSDLARLMGRAPERVPLPRDAIIIEADRERFVLLSSRWSTLRELVVSAIRDFHTTAPDEPGPDAGRLRRMTLPDSPDALWRALIDSLVHERSVVRSGPWLNLSEHVVMLSDDDRALVQKLQPLIAAGRFDPPWVRDLATAVHEPEERVRRLLRKQAADGAVYQVVHDLFYDSERIRELADVVASVAQEHGAVQAAVYRDAVGLGRKRAIQILEFFDRIGYTRRVQDSHVLQKQAPGFR
jgi:selenocysteine-specific elongation factor